MHFIIFLFIRIYSPPTELFVMQMSFSFSFFFVWFLPASTHKQEKGHSSAVTLFVILDIHLCIHLQLTVSSFAHLASVHFQTFFCKFLLRALSTLRAWGLELFLNKLFHLITEFKRRETHSGTLNSIFCLFFTKCRDLQCHKKATGDECIYEWTQFSQLHNLGLFKPKVFIFFQVLHIAVPFPKVANDINGFLKYQHVNCTCQFEKMIFFVVICYWWIIFQMFQFNLACLLLKTPICASSDLQNQCSSKPYITVQTGKCTIMACLFFIFTCSPKACYLSHKPVLRAL